MRIRYIATAFIENEEAWLLMKRSSAAKLAPNYWYGLGGHFEANEHTSPLQACLREIEEESGLKAENLVSIKLKQIVLRRSNDETVFNFVFFAKTKQRQMAASTEGELFWITQDKLTDRLMGDVIKQIILQLLQIKDEPGDQVYVGVMNGLTDSKINWLELTNYPQII